MSVLSVVTVWELISFLFRLISWRYTLIYAKLLLIVKTKEGLKENFRIRMLEGHHVYPDAAESGVREERLQKTDAFFFFHLRLLSVSMG